MVVAANRPSMFLDGTRDFDPGIVDQHIDRAMLRFDCRNPSRTDDIVIHHRGNSNRQVLA